MPCLQRSWPTPAHTDLQTQAIRPGAGRELCRTARPTILTTSSSGMVRIPPQPPMRWWRSSPLTISRESRPLPAFPSPPTLSCCAAASAASGFCLAKSAERDAIRAEPGLQADLRSRAIKAKTGKSLQPAIHSAFCCSEPLAPGRRAGWSAQQHHSPGPHHSKPRFRDL